MMAFGLSKLFPCLQDVFRGPRQVLLIFLRGNGDRAVEVREHMDHRVHVEEKESIDNACPARVCILLESLIVQCSGKALD